MSNDSSPMSPEVTQEANLLKQLYFWSFIAFGFIAPFSGIFFKKILVDAQGEPDVIKIGAILTMAPIMGFIANLVAGIISDKTQKGRHIISMLCIVSFVTALFVGFSGSPIVMALSLSDRFIFLLITVLLYRFTMIPLNSLLDSEAMQFLSKHSDRSQYGSYRFYGTLGWAVATPIMGAILWKTGNYQYIFYVGAFAYLVFAYLGFKSSGNAEVAKVKISWKHIIKNWKFLIFLVFTFLAGVVENSTSTYMGYFFDDVMDTPLKIGLIFSFWTTLEIPVMKYSKQLINFLGNRGLIVLGLLLGAIKLVLFSLFTLETPFYLQLLAALIHGPAFAFLFLGTIDIVDRMAHNTLRATYMGTTSIARNTIAGVVGGSLGAILIQNYGGAQFMRIGAVAFLLLIPFFLIFVKSE